MNVLGGVFSVLLIAAVVVWVGAWFLALVDAVKRPQELYPSGHPKSAWVLALLVTGWAGGLIALAYFLSVRRPMGNTTGWQG